ncbi:protein of unknown function [Candidatus Promineifilum breve]|uniref:Uncharacterized protein n=1 Tax=Candidatus Promineifilum breve TaxID=1806508 RepID=A0A160SXB0_9CHLR|nr:hypothetical protein [Candidatus Promineifilum breve]CUS01901.1 protein of unknown function [Candidatus Promineifilum breve]
MTTITETIWPAVVSTVGFEEDNSLLAMHFSEIEEEAENVLELLTVLRNNAYHSDRDQARDTAADLTIALEHLSHHLGELLPRLQEQLDIQP